MIAQEIRRLIEDALESVGIDGGDFVVEHPADLKMGDYSTNVGIKFRDKRDAIFAYIDTHKSASVESVELVGPGFINFHLSKEFFKESLDEVVEKGGEFGKSEHAKGYKVMVEHTDPNPFKEFHIGHLMPNVIGSTIARICEWNGAEVKQANYQGDKGLHVAKAVWAMLKGHGWREAYVLGNKAYEESSDAKKEIEELNKKIYEATDSEVMSVYERGKKESLEYFEDVYKKLNSHFDYYFFESETAKVGENIVRQNIGKVFEESDGAIVFRGEKFDPKLHTRVFINSQGIPTYEAKDLGNAKNKYDTYAYDLSIVVTGNEIKEYFRVMLAALKMIYPELAAKTKHLPHGMLRLPTGKMSSRTGDVITAESLIEEVKERVKGDEGVAIGAIKYMILRQAIGGDIVFDIEKSVSTEGDSGVYLQYAHARSSSVLEKAQGVKGSDSSEDETSEVERFLYRFPEVVERAGAEYAPHYIVTYLTELASSFNRFYANKEIIGNIQRLNITKAFNVVMKNGLSVLGITAPEKM